MQSVHLENSSGDQSTKRIAQLLSDEQGGIPFPELFLGVPIVSATHARDQGADSPCREVVQGAGEEDRLRCA
jgi:hypothetical protein